MQPFWLAASHSSLPFEIRAPRKGEVGYRIFVVRGGGGAVSSQPPGDEGKSREFRLIEGGAVPDNVVRARTWCEAHPGTLIVFEDGWYSCLREGEVIASSITLAALLDKLQRMFPDEGAGPS